MRIGLLGGTFDPVHYGHLLLAESCREAHQLDRVWFMPTAVPPHKQDAEITAAAHRLEMLALAIAGNAAFEICRYEVDRGGVNYTVDTLEQLQKAHPGNDWFFLLGGDSVAELGTWRQPSRICELATLVAVERAGMAPLDWSALTGTLTAEQIDAIRQHTVAMPRIDISARDLRARTAAGKSIRYRTPRAVEKYIETQRLYSPQNG
jgi:nicotinate-nucleotide adenylyltransferase